MLSLLRVVTRAAVPGGTAFRPLSTMPSPERRPNDVNVRNEISMPDDEVR